VVIPDMAPAVAALRPPAPYEEIVPYPTGAVSWGRWFKRGSLRICIAIELGKWHMSISHPLRYPHWDEIKTARYALCPSEITMALILPPPEQYVNLHKNCFHLHEIDG